MTTIRKYDVSRVLITNIPMLASFAVLYMWCVNYTLAPAPAHDQSFEVGFGLAIALLACVERLVSRAFSWHQDRIGFRLFRILFRLFVLGMIVTLIRHMHGYLPNPIFEQSMRILFVSLISTFVGQYMWEIRKCFFQPVPNDGKAKEWLTQPCPRCEQRLVNVKTGYCHGCRALYPFIEVPDPPPHLG